MLSIEFRIVDCKGGVYLAGKDVYEGSDFLGALNHFTYLTDVEDNSTVQLTIKPVENGKMQMR